jgi:colanic acid biosynthesis protein WcaH
MTLTETIASLEQQIVDPTVGLPEEIFLFASRITPLVNVDLLVRDSAGRTLLSWRDDTFSGQGWHVPGGIIRFKETIEMRIQKVAQQELGTEVTFHPQPVAIHQLMHPTRKTRGHFLSLLFSCSVPSGFIPPNEQRKTDESGYLKWHDKCPENLISVHEVYRPYICACEKGNLGIQQPFSRRLPL